METEKFIESRKVSDYEIWTDEGWVDIQEVHKTIKFDVWVVETENFEIQCADEHIVIGENREEIYVKDLKIGDKIITENGAERVIRVERLDVEPEHMYDLSIDSENHTFFSNGILSHNSTLATIFMLWVAIFQDDQRILLVANKESTAKEIFRRIRVAYEGLPNWLKAPVTYYGLESLELQNGSRISITTTTGTAGRGSSANLLFVDEMDFIECVGGDTKIKIKNKNTHEDKEAQISEIYKENPDNWEILTDNGWKSFSGVIKKEETKCVKITFDDGTDLICSEDHEMMTISGVFILAKKSRYKKIYSENGFKKVISVKKSKNQDTYDVTDVDGGRYYTNSVISHNCNMLEDFWSSVYPIISSSKKSKIIVASTPKDTSGLLYKLYDGSVKQTNNWVNMKVLWNDVPDRDEKWKRETIAALGDEKIFSREFEVNFDEVGESALDIELFDTMKKHTMEPMYVYESGSYLVWEKPNENHIYVAGVDISEGVGKDASVIQILDITDPQKIIQAAVYHNNKITPSEFTPKLREILQHWGDPFAMIERNNCGGQVVDNLKRDFNYDNIVNWGIDMVVNKTSSKLGIVSHTNTKYHAIMNQRYWINTVKSVQINDINTVMELKDFVRLRNNTWGAKHGTHDDRVMSLAWALMILHEKLADVYFDVVEKDEFNKPSIIKSIDYGIKHYFNPLSLYTNEKDGIGGDALPTFMGGYANSDSPELEDLHNMGWTKFGEF
jgi:hypothetical protein